MSVRVGSYDSSELLNLYRETIRGPWKTVGLDVQYRIDTIGCKKIVTFQGTVEMMDVLLDMSAWVRPYQNMKKVWFGHAGFYTGYHSARDEIMEDLGNPLYIEARGYSLGSAYASIFHEDIVFNRPGVPISTYAFGTPRITWFPPKSIQERFSGLYRVNTRSDPVAMLPPAWWGYRHVGEETLFGDAHWFPKKDYHMWNYYVRILEGV